ncbi:MAG: hypothetical protein H6741_08900 [Alphaproteobacteria bacterium]|nr:hypothetical protein [Alphaproteobacteria bacterium]MCB9792832.1 hypothetical protein [Alphaproteobacteria bacterium]
MIRSLLLSLLLLPACELPPDAEAGHAGAPAREATVAEAAVSAPEVPGALAVGEHLRVLAPITHGSVTLFPVVDVRAAAAPEALHRTLAAAFEAQAIEVTELDDSGSVPTLRFTNTGDLPIFATAGEVVLGGKQDRVLTEDILLKPGETQAVAVNCVERGRWSEGAQGAAFSYGGRSEVALRRVLRTEKDQGRTWEAVSKLNADKTTKLKEKGLLEASDAGLAPATGTYRASLTDGRVGQLVEDRMAALLPPMSEVERGVGMIVALNGQIESYELHAAASTWSQERSSAIRGVVLESVSRPETSTAAPSLADAQAVLADALTASVVQADQKGEAVRSERKGAGTRGYVVGTEAGEVLKMLGYVE